MYVRALADDVSRAELAERMRDATRGMHTELEETERKRQAGVGALAPRPIVLAACEDEVVTSRQVAGWYEGAQQVDADAALGDENKRHAARLATWVRKNKLRPEKDAPWGRGPPQPWALRTGTPAGQQSAPAAAAPADDADEGADDGACSTQSSEYGKYADWGT